MEQIIKFGISNYLQLCVEAGFSQIQSHITLEHFAVVNRAENHTTRVAIMSKYYNN